MISEVYNEDCMSGMKRYPDKFFNLAIVDPPYGILSNAGDRLDKYGTKHKQWDEYAPNEEYFTELNRISKNQIIWGGNYFYQLWAGPVKGFIFWYKHQPIDNWAHGEMAWTSFDRPARCFSYPYYGNINAELERFHPTQKPVALYKWLLKNYAKPGDKILDTHLGSGSSRIAAYDMGFDFTGFEIDKDYFEAQEKRFSNHIKQLNLFTHGSTKQNTTASLFEAREDFQVKPTGTQE